MSVSFWVPVTSRGGGKFTCNLTFTTSRPRLAHLPKKNTQPYCMVGPRVSSYIRTPPAASTLDLFSWFSFSSANIFELFAMYLSIQCEAQRYLSFIVQVKHFLII